MVRAYADLQHCGFPVIGRVIGDPVAIRRPRSPPLKYVAWIVVQARRSISRQRRNPDLHFGAGEAPVGYARAIWRNLTVQEAVGLAIREIMRANDHSLRPVSPVAKPDLVPAVAVGGINEMHTVRSPTRRHLVPVGSQHGGRWRAVQRDLDQVVASLAGLKRQRAAVRRESMMPLLRDTRCDFPVLAAAQVPARQVAVAAAGVARPHDASVWQPVKAGAELAHVAALNKNLRRAAIHRDLPEFRLRAHIGEQSQVLAVLGELEDELPVEVLAQLRNRRLRKRTRWSPRMRGQHQA